MLAGFALMVLPVLAHLVHRKAQRTVVFPTVALLKFSSAQLRHGLHLRRWGLLLIRLLMVALIVLAFARPQWWAGPIPSQQQGHDVVLLFDVSASTAQQSQGVSAHDQLRAQAQRTLNSLIPRQDRVNLIVADDHPQLMFDQFTTNLDAVREQVDRLTPTFGRADLKSALSLGARVLTSTRRPGHLVIFSDFQATHWDDVQHHALPADIKLTLVPWAGTDLPNVALHHPRLDQADAKTLRITAVNFGSQSQRVEVAAHLDDQPLPKQRVILEPGQSHDLTFQTDLSPGSEWHRVRFGLVLQGDDALASDNVAYLSVREVSQVTVGVVGQDRLGEAGYFLRRALSPYNTQADRYDVQMFKPSDTFTPAALVFISPLSTWSETDLAQLRDHITQGGTAVVFADAGPMGQALNTLLPGVLGRRIEQREMPIHLGQVNADSPVFEPFDERSQLALKNITFHHTWQHEQPPQPSSETLLWFEDGTPAMEKVDVGAGQLVIAHFGITSDMGDLPEHGGFVALVQALAQHLSTPRQSLSPRLAGGPLTLVLPGETDRNQPLPTVLDPTGGPMSEVHPRFDATGLHLDLPCARQTGFYTAKRFGQPTLALAEVNLDPRESDLRRADLHALAKGLQGSTQNATVYDLADHKPMLSTVGRPLWGILLALAMGLLGLELLLLGIWRR